MRQLFLNKSNLIIKEVAQPLLDESSLLVAVHYAYITSNTDIVAMKASEGFLSSMPHKVKRMLETVASPSDDQSNEHAYATGNGYACVGQVISVGKKIAKYAPGDFVACLAMHYAVHTDVICIQEQYAVKISDTKYLKQAALVPFAADALHAIHRANIRIGSLIGIFGLDVHGLLMVQLAKAAGCRVIAVDSNQHCLDKAMALGATYTLHIAHEDMHKEIMLITERYGLNTIFLTSEESSFFDQAILAAGKQATLVLFGNGIRSLHQTKKIKDINILVIRDSLEIPSNGMDAMRTCLALLEQGVLSYAPLVEDYVAIKKLPQAYQRLQKKLSIGILVAYEQMGVSSGAQLTIDQHANSESEKKFIPAITDCVRVGFVGMSEVTSSIIVPLVAKMRNVAIKGIFDEDARKSNVLFSKYNVAKLLTKEEMLSSELCDVVIISTAHTLHADYALQALQQGKPVFLERPMVTDFNQLQRIIAYMQDHENARLAVGYSYSFSPFAKKIKQTIQKRRTPLMAHYRINRELTQIERRMTHSMGAGRIIGDMCQIVDLFCYLTEASPICVSVESMHAARDDIFPTDNVSAQIAFTDGSVCSFLYTTLGHADMGSERLEIFYDGKVILMEDYMELYGFGLSSWFNETLTSPDRGYEAIITQFFKTLDDPNPLIPFARLQQVAQITLIIDQLACEGGGKKEL